MATNTPPYHHWCWLLNLVLITIWMVLYLFSPEDTTSMISKNNLKCGLVRPQHTLTLCVSPSQMNSGSEKSAAFLDIVDIRLWLDILSCHLSKICIINAFIPHRSQEYLPFWNEKSLICFQIVKLRGMLYHLEYLNGHVYEISSREWYHLCSNCCIHH